MPNSLPFYLVDVFADAPYNGNQLAVFLNGSSLSTTQMQQMAQEIGFAESVFILSDEVKNGGLDVRIFTVEYEVPFAGHPTLGAAYVAQQFIFQELVSEIILNEVAGQIPVAISYKADRPDFLMMKQITPDFGPEISRPDTARVLGLAPDSLHPSFPLQVISTGLPYLLIPIQTLKDVQNAQVNPTSLLSFLKDNGLFKTQRPDALTVGLFLFCPETYTPSHHLNTRMLVLENGKVIEDAATGSANGCLLSYLLKYNYLGSQSEIDILVEQGYEIKRKASIRLKGTLSADGRYDINVGGQVQLVAKGEWMIPDDASI